MLVQEIAVVWGKTGIITTHHHGANPWKIYRKFIDPAFKLTALRALQSIFDQHSREFVLYLQSLGDNAVIEMESELKKLTLSIIADVIGCGKEAVDPGFLDSLNVIITALNSPLIFLPFGTHLWIYLHRKDYDAVINNINRVIRERRIKNESQKEVRVRDMLDILLSEDSSGRVLTDDEARDQLIQIFIAGTDTTANTLAWFFYIISNNMEYQRRLIEEVDTLADFTQETLDKSMPYTFQLFQETMRVYPPVLYLARETGDTAVELPSGVTVPPNVMVQVGPLVLHRNPEYWSDPDKFDPERWAEGGEAFTEKCKHAFIPFSAGPRQCAGKLFFYKEAKTIVSHIFSSFEFHPHEHKDNGVMSSKAGLMKPRAVWVKLKRRG
ncbi:cytochrome P450 [Paraphysoderma sedebokerense]|nr:cytochrome P450 [Paraphysoderma sedebokerense]